MAKPKHRAPASSPTVAPAVDGAAANEAFIRGDYARAVELYTSILSNGSLKKEDREGSLVNRGYAYIKIGRAQEAVADLRQALTLDPNDCQASSALFQIQNGKMGAASPQMAANGTAPAGVGWGPLARLPGRYWIVSTVKPIMYVRYEWAKVGISIIYAGHDALGNCIEGQYFLDPVTNAIRSNSTYRKRQTVASVEVAPDSYTETGKGGSGPEKQITALQSDGTFTIATQKPKGKDWQTISVATFMPASEEIIRSLGWPTDAPERPSFWKGIGDSLKAGAIEGLHDGTRDGIHDAVQDRVRKVTHTTQPVMCQTVYGTLVPCP